MKRLYVAGLLSLGFMVRVALGDAEDDLTITAVRHVIKADRQQVVTQSLQLSDSEAKEFWPLYHEYRAEMDAEGDRMVALVKEYAKAYPDVPSDRAKVLLKELLSIEKQRLATRTSYLKKFGKILDAPKNLRFAQVENRLDLALQLKLATIVPLVPIEGEMKATSNSAAVVAEGVPGGVYVETHELQVTVAAIDKTARTATLVSSDGIKTSVKAGPEVVNFDQLDVGDRIKVQVAEELVVQMARPGETTKDGEDSLVTLAPKGTRPGGLVASTVQVTGTVAAIDLPSRKVTLRFEDGSSKAFPVRKDIDLSVRKVGEKVVIRRTQAIAISVTK